METAKAIAAPSAVRHHFQILSSDLRLVHNNDNRSGQKIEYICHIWELPNPHFLTFLEFESVYAAL